MKNPFGCVYSRSENTACYRLNGKRKTRLFDMSFPEILAGIIHHCYATQQTTCIAIGHYFLSKRYSLSVRQARAVTMMMNNQNPNCCRLAESIKCVCTHFLTAPKTSIHLSLSGITSAPHVACHIYGYIYIYIFQPTNLKVISRN